MERKQERKQRSRDKEGDRQEQRDRRRKKKKAGMLRPRGSERFQMIAFHKVVFYTASDLLSIYGGGY